VGIVRPCLTVSGMSDVPANNLRSAIRHHLVPHQQSERASAPAGVCRVGWPCRWTITETCSSPDGRFLLYASIQPTVHLVDVGSPGGPLESLANVTEVGEPASSAVVLCLLGITVRADHGRGAITKPAEGDRCHQCTTNACVRFV
jgi:hypothetical protein